MLKFTATAAAIAGLMTLTPAPAKADSRDALAGAVIGGAIVGIIAHEKNKKKRAERERAERVYVDTTPAPKRTYVNTAARTEVRQVQTALNYFDFPAGPEDGVRGQQTRTGISTYQAYMGYPVTGTLTDFEEAVLLNSYAEVKAPKSDTFDVIARSPDGTRGLLKHTQAEFAAGAVTGS